MENIKQILVVSRMIPFSQNALHYGISLARMFNAKLTVLHFVSNPVEMMAVNAPGVFPEEEYINYFNSLQEGKEQLASIIKREIQVGFPINELISDRDSVDEIVKVVGEKSIDLIVMLAQEEGFLEHALFGGENDALIRRMPCSILLVKNEPGAVLSKEKELCDEPV